MREPPHLEIDSPYDDLLARHHVRSLTFIEQRASAASALSIPDDELARRLVVSPDTARGQAGRAQRKVFDTLDLKGTRTLLGRWCMFHWSCCTAAAAERYAAGTLFVPEESQIDRSDRPQPTPPTYHPKHGPWRDGMKVLGLVSAAGVVCALALIATANALLSDNDPGEQRAVSIAFVGEGDPPLDREQRERLGVVRLDAHRAATAAIQDIGAWVVMFEPAAVGKLPPGSIRNWYESGLVVMGLEMTTGALMDMAEARPDEALADLQPPPGADFVVGAGPSSGTRVLPNFEGPFAAYIARTSTEIFGETRCFRGGRGYFEFDEPLFTATLNTKRGIAEGRMSSFDGTIGRLACGK